MDISIYKALGINHLPFWRPPQYLFHLCWCLQKVFQCPVVPRLLPAALALQLWCRQRLLLCREQVPGNKMLPLHLFWALLVAVLRKPFCCLGVGWHRGPWPPWGIISSRGCIRMEHGWSVPESRNSSPRTNCTACPQVWGS